MPQKIYTTADRDKYTNLYNDYQNRKDTYTPEQQQKIENAFAQVSRDIDQSLSERHLIDIHADANRPWEVFAQYNDWTSEWIKDPNYVAPAPAPRKTVPTPKQTITTPRQEQTIPEWYTQNEVDRHWPIWPQDGSSATWWFDTTWWFRTHDWWYASPDLTTKIWVDWSVYMWEPIYDPAIVWSYKLNDDWTAQFVWQWWSTVYVSDPKAYEDLRSTLQPRQKEWREYLMRYSKAFQDDVNRIINRWWYIDAEWFLHRQDWTVITKL